MSTNESSNAPDCERIARKIVKVLFESGVTYRETEIVMEYVYCKLREQRVQDNDVLEKSV